MPAPLAVDAPHCFARIIHPHRSQNVLAHEMPHPLGRGAVATAGQVNVVVAATLSGLGKHVPLLLRLRLKQCNTGLRVTVRRWTVVMACKISTSAGNVILGSPRGGRLKLEVFVPSPSL